MKAILVIGIELVAQSLFAGTLLLPYENKEGKAGFLSEDGKCAIPCRYDWVAPFSHGISAVKASGVSAYIDERGNKALPKWDMDEGNGGFVHWTRFNGSFNDDGFAFVRCDSARDSSIGPTDVVYRCIDTDGKVIFSVTTDIFNKSFPEMHAKVTVFNDNDTYMLYDLTGVVRFRRKLRSLHVYEDGCAVCSDEKMGIGFSTSPLDGGWHWFPTNEVRYATYDHLSKIVSCMKKTGEAPIFQFYSVQLQEMQELESKMRKYDWHSYFKDGKAVVARKSGEELMCGVVDAEGKEIVPCSYRNIGTTANYSLCFAKADYGEVLKVFDNNGVEKCVVSATNVGSTGREDIGDWHELTLDGTNVWMRLFDGSLLRSHAEYCGDSEDSGVRLESYSK